MYYSSKNRVIAVNAKITKSLLCGRSSSHAASLAILPSYDAISQKKMVKAIAIPSASTIPP